MIQEKSYQNLLKTNPNLPMMQQTLDGLSSKEEMANQIGDFSLQGMLTDEEAELLAQMYGIYL